MSLTERELQQMRDIERRLAREDPSFARRMTNPVTGRAVGLMSAGHPPRGRTLALLAAVAAAYMVFSFVLVLAVAGTISMGAFTFAVVVDLLAVAGVIALGRSSGRRPRSARIRTLSPAAPGGLWWRRHRPGW